MLDQMPVIEGLYFFENHSLIFKLVGIVNHFHRDFDRL